MQAVKLVVVGDGSVGKTCFLIVHTTGQFPTEYIPTVFDNYSPRTYQPGQVLNIGLWDTAGEGDYDKLRPLSYPNTDIFLILFSVSSPSSFQNVKDKWILEIKHYSPDSHVILVGNKTDLKDDTETIKLLQSRGENFISFSEGQKMAKQIKAIKYCECSTLKNEGIQQVFDEVSNIILPKVNPRSSSCLIL